MSQDAQVLEAPVEGRAPAYALLPWLLVAVIGVALFVVWLSLSSTIRGQQDLLRERDAQIASKDAQIAELKAANARTVETANAKLKDLAQEADARLRSLAAEATEKLQAASLPEVPIQALFRKAVMHSGKVLLLRNTSGSSMPVSVELSRPGGGGGRSFELVLDPGQGKEIGEREGWAFVPGDLIEVSRPQYKTVRFRVP